MSTERLCIELEHRIPGFTQFWNAFYSLRGIEQPSDVAAYAALCSYASEPKESDRHVNPSLSSLCARAHMGETALRQALARLEQAGAIRIDRVAGRRSRVIITSLYRFVRTPTDSEGVSTDTPTECEGDPLGICGGPPRNPRTKKTSKKTSSDERYLTDFHELWALYPRKVGKQEALRAYGRLRRRGVEHGGLIRAVTTYASEQAGADPKFIKHCSSFLNGGRWEDYCDGAGPEPAAHVETDDYAPLFGGRQVADEA